MDSKALVQAYWSQFKVVRFHQQLPDDSGDYLVLPEIFVKNVKVKWSKLKTLETKASSWPVKLKLDDHGDVLMIKRGWKEFVKAHCLKKDDIVIFKYHHDNQSVLKVSLYDTKTCGENPSGFYVQRELLDQLGARSNRKEKTKKRKKSKAQQKDDDADRDRPGTSHSARKKSKTVIHEDSGDKSEQPVGMGDGTDGGACSSPKENTKKCKKRKAQQKGDGGDPDSPRTSRSPRKKSKKVIHEDSRDDREQAIGTGDTDESSKVEILSKAEKLKKDGDVVVYMNRTYIQKASFMNVSMRWARRQGLSQTQNVELRWRTSVLPAKFHFVHPNAGISTGWKQFVEDTGLKFGDACIFSVLPVRGDGGCVCIGVNIVRLETDENKEEENATESDSYDGCNGSNNLSAGKKACDDKKEPVRRGIRGKHGRGRSPKAKEANGDLSDSDDNSQQSARNTEAMKDRTMAKANEMKDDGETVSYMSPPCISRRGNGVVGVYCSVRWARDHGLNQKQDVELHCKGKVWRVNFYMDPMETIAAFHRGWEDFVTGNCIEVGDACIFSVLPGSVRGSGGCVCVGVRIVKGESESEE